MTNLTNTDWLNKNEYPFKSHFYKTSAGNMHYVDEGTGEAIIFVHGNPSWSFEFRNMIKILSDSFRCIAPDHIGFGLSDKPHNWSYLPIDHAKNLDDFLESLNLKDITLVVGDWGGPIGLSYLLNHQEKVKNVVITNTWLWSLKNDLYYQVFSSLAGGVIGRYFIKKYNFFVKFLVKALYGNKKKLSKEVHKHFIMPFNNPLDRTGNWIFPKQLIDSSVWLDSLYNKIDLIKMKNVLIAWGMKDNGFRKNILEKWIRILPAAKVIRYPDTGHFVSEEKSEELSIEIMEFITEK